MARGSLGTIGPKGGLTLAAVNRLDLIEPEEVLSYDDIIVATAGGLKRLEVNSLAGVLNTGRMGGWSPTQVSGSVCAYDFSRKDTLFRDTARTLAMLSDGTNELVAGVLDLSGNGRHLSETDAAERVRYNSANLVNGRTYLEARETDDVLVMASTFAAGTTWTTGFACYVGAADVRDESDWTFPILQATDTGGLCIGIDENAAVRIHGLFGFDTSTTDPIPLDEWCHVLVTYDTAVGLKVWVNGDAYTVGDIDIGRNYTGPTGTLFRNGPLGADSDDGCALAYLFHNSVAFDADQRALMFAFGDERIGAA